MENKVETATFAAGCFWGVEETFRKTEGVLDVTSGYTGGSTENPTYKEVSGGESGHAETVRILFNPSIVSYKKLLDIFWESHDPTTLDRQGPDVGLQYRSAIFYHGDAQQQEAVASKEALEASGKHSGPVVTEIVPAVSFYKAEEYHQRYFEKQGT